MSSEVQQLVRLVEQERYAHLVFDLDETITELNLPWEEWIRRVTAIMPLRLAAQLKDALEGKIEQSWAQIINSNIRADSSFYTKYITICQDFEGKYFAHTPYLELVKALPQLKSFGSSFYLWTNNIRGTAERALKELGVQHLFSQLSARDDVLFGKPNLEGFNTFRFNITSEACLLIGDSKTDEQAAAAAGVDYYQINYFK